MADIVPIVDTVVQHHAVLSLPLGEKTMNRVLVDALKADSTLARVQPPVDFKKPEVLAHLHAQVCEVAQAPLEPLEPAKHGKKDTPRIDATLPSGQRVRTCSFFDMNSFV